MLKIKILIVDDSDIICQALKDLIKAEKKFEVVGIVQDGLAALNYIENFQQPHVVLMDLNMPQMGGIKCTEKICRQFPSTKVIIISDLDNPGIVSCAMKNGAKGFLSKDLTAGKLINAIWAVEHGCVQLEEKFAEHLFLQNSLLPKKSFTNEDSKPKVQGKKKSKLVLQDAWA